MMIMIKMITMLAKISHVNCYDDSERYRDDCDYVHDNYSDDGGSDNDEFFLCGRVRKLSIYTIQNVHNSPKVFAISLV